MNEEAEAGVGKDLLATAQARIAGQAAHKIIWDSPALPFFRMCNITYG
jgi:hypothetical protein